MNTLRYFFTLFVVLFSYSLLSAQDVDKDGEFYLDFAGSAVFPYDPNPLAGLGLKAGPGFTAAFGYAFKEGFSTEIEWGYQKAGIGNRIENSSRNIPPLTFSGPDGQVSQPDATIFTPVIVLDGEIKTQSLMGNAYYRYPKWRVSPYVGFGLGAFFHDKTSTVSIEFGPLPPRRTLGQFAFTTPPRRTPHSHIRGFPVCLSDHGGPLGSGLQTRGVPLWLSLSLKPRGADRCRPD